MEVTERCRNSPQHLLNYSAEDSASELLPTEEFIQPKDIHRCHNFTDLMYILNNNRPNREVAIEGNNNEDFFSPVQVPLDNPNEKDFLRVLEKLPPVRQKLILKLFEFRDFELVTALCQARSEDSFLLIQQYPAPKTSYFSLCAFAGCSDRMDCKKSSKADNRFRSFLPHRKVAAEVLLKGMDRYGLRCLVTLEKERLSRLPAINYEQFVELRKIFKTLHLPCPALDDRSPKQLIKAYLEPYINNNDAILRKLLHRDYTSSFRMLEQTIPWTQVRKKVLFVVPQRKSSIHGLKETRADVWLPPSFQAVTKSHFEEMRNEKHMNESKSHDRLSYADQKPVIKSRKSDLDQDLAKWTNLEQTRNERKDKRRKLEHEMETGPSLHQASYPPPRQEEQMLATRRPIEEQVLVTQRSTEEQATPLSEKAKREKVTMICIIEYPGFFKAAINPIGTLSQFALDNAGISVEYWQIRKIVVEENCMSIKIEMDPESAHFITTQDFYLRYKKVFAKFVYT